MLQGGGGQGPPGGESAGTSRGGGDGGGSARDRNLFDGMLHGAGGQGPPGDGSGGGGGARDRLSNIPDELCHCIFSFLKAWEVVRTSALSKRWRYMSESAPSLDIRHDASADRLRFHYRQFVQDLLQWRDQDVPLVKLRLRWTSNNMANTWIRRAVRLHATAIELSGMHHHRRPHLDCDNFLFGSLKILHLSRVFMDTDNLKQLSCRCVFLGELVLKNSKVYGTEIRSASLRHLTMVSCFTPKGLLVDAPGLALLCCIRLRPCSVLPQIKRPRSLVKASIMLDDGSESHDDGSSAGPDAEDPDGSGSDDDGSTAGSHAEDPDEREFDDDDGSSAGSNDVHPNHIVDCYGRNGIVVYGGHGILRSFYNVRTMELLAHREEVLLKSQLKMCPMFKNLKTLSLGEWCIGPDFDALSTILEHSPNLENLYLHLDKVYDNRGEVNPSGRSFPYKQLKMVKIVCSKDDMMAHTLAEFFHAVGVPHGKIVIVPRNGKGGTDSGEKRKAREGDAKSSAKQRRV